jgi:hypothetical protein
MKQALLLILLLAGSITLTQAQGRPPANEGRMESLKRVEALKIGFLTRQLELTPEEAEKFWPVYNKYTEDLRKAQKENFQSDLSELEREEKILELRKKYRSEFTKVLSAEKVNKMYQAEKEFRGMVQREIMERRGQRPGKKNPGPPRREEQ